MAYLKAGELSKAINLLNEGKSSGVLNNMNYIALKEKIQILNTQNLSNVTTTNYDQTLALLKQNKEIFKGMGIFGTVAEFYAIMEEFCQHRK